MADPQKDSNCKMVFYAKSLCNQDASVPELVELETEDFVDFAHSFNLIDADGAIIYVQKFFPEDLPESDL